MKKYKYESYKYDFLGLPKYNDAERKFTASISEAISREIDRQILEYLKNGLKFDYSYEIKR